MRLERLTDLPPAAPWRTEPPTFHVARVATTDPAGGCTLVDGRRVSRAAGCVLAPAAGDRVLCLESADGHWVVQVLARAAPAVAELSVAGAEVLRLHQAEVQLVAERALSLGSLGALELTAAGGLSLQGRDVFLTAVETLIESARQRLAEAEHYALEVKTLLRMQAGDALLTAARDIKVDAERISMG